MVAFALDARVMRVIVGREEAVFDQWTNASVQSASRKIMSS